MMKALLTRPDTRREVIGVVLAGIIIVALCFAHRHPAPAATRSEQPPALQTIRIGDLHLDLLRVEACRATGIATAEIRVTGIGIGQLNPITAATFNGAHLDGGIFSGSAVAPGIVTFTGAAGEPAKGVTGPGIGLDVLRFKTLLPNHPVRLRVFVQGRWWSYSPLMPESVPPFIRGPLRFALGK